MLAGEGDTALCDLSAAIDTSALCRISPMLCGNAEKSGHLWSCDGGLLRNPSDLCDSSAFFDSCDNNGNVVGINLNNIPLIGELLQTWQRLSHYADHIFFC